MLTWFTSYLLPRYQVKFFLARFRYGLVEISKTSIITFWVRIETSLWLFERPYQTVITVQQLHTVFLNCVTLPIGHRVCLPPTNECKASRCVINALPGSRHTFNGSAVPSTAYVWLSEAQCFIHIYLQGCGVLLNWSPPCNPWTLVHGFSQYLVISWSKHSLAKQQNRKWFGVAANITY